jgi:RNA polymerase sigma-70 factor (ECF subfamily)
MMINQVSTALISRDHLCLDATRHRVRRDRTMGRGRTRRLIRARTAMGDDTRDLGEAEPPFAEFLRRIRAGDESAAVELVRRYEPALRLEIRLRLRDPRLRRLLEPADLCQSVLKSFFLRAALGQFDLDSPEKLLALLRTMARNKVAQQARKHKALRRNVNRDVSLDAEAPFVPAADASPSRIAIGREMWEALRGQLTPEELRVADRRSQGREWAEIARELGGTAQSRRKQLARAVDRASRELGLDKDEGEDSDGPE